MWYLPHLRHYRETHRKWSRSNGWSVRAPTRLQISCRLTAAMRRAFLFVMSLCLITNPQLGDAQGNSSSHPFMILSEGLSTCGEYTSEPEKQAIRVEWVLGYISGGNSCAPLPETMVGSSFQMPATVFGWLQSYCTSHPLNIMAAAAEALRRDFRNHER